MGSQRGVVVGVARWSARHPVRAVLGWLLFVALCLGAGALTGTNKGTLADFRVGEAGRAEAAAEAAGLTPPPVEQILLAGADGRAVDAAAAAVAPRVAGLTGVAGVGAPARSGDGALVRVPVTLAGSADDAKRVVPGLQAAVTALAAQHPGVSVTETGSASLSVGTNARQSADLGRTESISLPVTFVVLVLAFGALFAAGVPVLLALSAVAGALGLYGVASWLVPDAGGAVTSVVFMLGMAVGVDYSLFAVKRVREERARAGGQLPAPDLDTAALDIAAVEAAAATAGRATVTAGIGIVAALAGLYLADDVIFSSVATGAVLVVAVAVAGALTALPALLAVLGRRVGGARHEASGGGRWAVLLAPATRRPVATLLAGTAAVVALAWPATTVALGTTGPDTFPRDIPAVAARAQLLAAFPDQGIAHLVVVRGATGAQLRDLAGRIHADPAFGGSTVRVTTSVDGSAALLTVPLPWTENSAPARASLTELRAVVLPGTDALVSGEVARGVDYADHQSERIPWVLGFVALTTFVVLAAAFGSVVLAAVGVLFNLAGVGIALGVLALVFQHRWAEGLLGFTATGFVEARMPLMICAVLVGLSTDYQIFVVSRIRELVASGMPTREAVAAGTARSASVVTSAAVIMISVFAGFLFMSQVELKEVGLGLAAAVLFDAVVLRTLLLPAVVTLLGERTWWPGSPAEVRGLAAGGTRPGGARSNHG